MPQGTGNASGSMLTRPRLEPRANALRKLFDDDGNAGVNVGASGGGHVNVSPGLEMNLSVSKKLMLLGTRTSRPKTPGEAVKDEAGGGRRMQGAQRMKRGREPPGSPGPILDGWGQAPQVTRARQASEFAPAGRRGEGVGTLTGAKRSPPSLDGYAGGASTLPCRNRSSRRRRKTSLDCRRLLCERPLLRTGMARQQLVEGTH